MPQCFFVSDLHGSASRVASLLAAVRAERPRAVFLGGDLLPGFGLGYLPAHVDFLTDVLVGGLERLRDDLGEHYPAVLLVLGNDDGRFEEATVLDAAGRGIWTYAHDRRVEVDDFEVYGYAYVPPTPFLLKDWERYDVSRYVDPGCVSPEEGRRSAPVPGNVIRHATIAKDLVRLFGERPLDRAIGLFHSPPYRTKLDRAALDGRMIDHVPLDVHVGSIAIARFIARRQPLVTLHGHVHESARLTGSWRDRSGRTHMFTAAHDGPELALVRFDPDAPETATRELV